MILPKALAAEMGYRPGDLILFVRYGPVLILRRAESRMVVERESIPTDALPPAHIGAKS